LESTIKTATGVGFPPIMSNQVGKNMYKRNPKGCGCATPLYI
jgi:hypothetical protein